MSETLTEFSPFDEAGPGNLDDLRPIGEIDQLYLFFRHMLFRLEQGSYTERRKL